MMANVNTALSVLNGYSLDTMLPCVADHEKIRVIVKIGQGPVGPSPLYKRILKEGHISERSAISVF